jgi:hypothetical protein
VFVRPVLPTCALASGYGKCLIALPSSEARIELRYSAGMDSPRNLLLCYGPHHPTGRPRALSLLVIFPQRPSVPSRPRAADDFTAPMRRAQTSPCLPDAPGPAPPCAHPPPVDSPSLSMSNSPLYRRVGAPLPADARPPGGCGESELDLLAAGMERRRILEATAHLVGGGGDFCHRQRLR